MKKTKLKVYAAPKVEIVEIETQCVLCASGVGGTSGGTESMNMTDVNWP